jgi:hypothetical protein
LVVATVTSKAHVRRYNRSMIIFAPTILSRYFSIIT